MSPGRTKAIGKNLPAKFQTDACRLVVQRDVNKSKLFRLPTNQMLVTEFYEWLDKLHEHNNNQTQYLDQYGSVHHPKS